MLLRVRIPVILGSGLVNKRKQLRAFDVLFLDLPAGDVCVVGCRATPNCILMICILISMCISIVFT